MNLSINYHHLRYFLAVAEYGGIKRASEALHVSSPTLSAQISALEHSLGVGLFLREGRRMKLTEAGRLVRGYAERIFSLGDEMAEVVSRGTTDGLEKVSIGITDSVPKQIASKIIAASLRESASLRIIVKEGSPAELALALASHQIDLMIANEAAPGPAQSLLHSVRIGEFGVQMMAMPSLRSRYRKSKGLNGFPVLVPTRGASLRIALERWWKESGVQPDVIAEFDDAAAMYDLATSGIGAAPVFSPLMATAKNAYGLEPLPLKTDIKEELFVISAPRQFHRPGPALLAKMAKTVL